MNWWVYTVKVWILTPTVNFKGKSILAPETNQKSKSLLVLWEIIMIFKYLIWRWSYSYQDEEPALEVLGILHTTKLGAVVVKVPAGVVVRAVTVLPSTDVQFLNVELVGLVQVLVWVPENTTIDGLTWTENNQIIWSLNLCFFNF